MLFSILVCKIWYIYMVNHIYHALSEHGFVSWGIPIILYDNEKDYGAGNRSILVFFGWLCYYYNQNGNIIAFSFIILDHLPHKLNFIL